MENNSSGRITAGILRRTVRQSFTQAVVGSIYAASTGGMFLIGYALALGATDAQIGLMSTIPMLCIGVQLVTAALVERGVSRRRMTFVTAVLNVAGWGLIILIPYVFATAVPAVKVSLLIGIITMVTFFAYMSGNARGSWVGDLIPERFRGTFFGRMAMYGGIAGTLFAVIEGAFLDVIKQHGMGAFSLLFGFGMVFGLISAFLFLPQPEMPLKEHKDAGNLWKMVRETFANRQFMMLAMFTTLWSLQSVAGPFYATYLLRDLHMSFLGVGILNASGAVSFLLSVPVWGRIVDRWGCRPVITACSAVLAPFPLIWFWMDTPSRVYSVIPYTNLIGGFLVGGVSVGLSTLVYKVTPKAGRSVQLAVYSIIVVMLAAPLPALGGHLSDWLHTFGLPRDLRYTFYLSSLFILLSAVVSRRIVEPGSRLARHMIRSLGNQWLAPVLRWLE
jgi:MFS family permease